MKVVWRSVSTVHGAQSVMMISTTSTLEWSVVSLILGTVHNIIPFIQFVVGTVADTFQQLLFFAYICFFIINFAGL